MTPEPLTPQASWPPPRPTAGLAHCGVVVYRAERGSDGTLEDLVVEWVAPGTDLAIAAEQVVGQAVGKLIPYEKLLLLRRHLDRAMRSGVPLQFDLPFKLDGHLYRVIAVPVDERVSCTYIDLTAVDEVTEAQRVAEERYRQFLDSLPALFARLDSDLRVLEITQGAADYVGATRGGLIGRRIEPDGPNADLANLVRLAIGTREPQRADVQVQVADGRRPRVDVEVVPEIDPDGEVHSVLLSGHDVTEVRLAAARLAEIQRLESLGELARGLAHDFNNLLQAILGHASLISEDLTSGRLKSSADQIVTAAGRAAVLVGQLQAYAGQRPVARTPLELGALAREVGKLARTGYPPDIDLTVERSGPVWVEADPAQLNQILMNLLVNASDAIGARRGNVRALVSRGQPPRLQWLGATPDPTAEVALISVADDGPGMPDEVRQHLFEPFFSTKGTGRGLGMAVVLGMVRAHGGAIAVDTAPGEGTTIHVALPLGRDPEADARPEARPDTRAGGTVLVVDDDELVREAACLMLQRLGWLPVPASGGRDAVARWREEGPFDLVLCDFAMKEMDGLATWKALDDLAPGVRVVLVSGHAAIELGEKRLTDGRSPAGTLPKPFDIAHLAAVVEAATEHTP